MKRVLNATDAGAGSAVDHVEDAAAVTLPGDDLGWLKLYENKILKLAAAMLETQINGQKVMGSNPGASKESCKCDLN